MYRANQRQLEKDAMSPAMEADALSTPPANQKWLEAEFVDRVSSLPVVAAAVGQLASLYQTTKESNRVFNYTLGLTESGVHTLASTTKPIVNKLEKPIGHLDNFACGQLDKLENTFPIITKPTEEVYDCTLKPTVDKVNGVTQYGLSTVTSIKDYGVTKVTDTVNYGKDTVNSVKDYSTNKVQGVKDYTYSTIEGVANYGTKTLNTAMATPAGQVLTNHLDQVLDTTEQYVDYYLPENKKSDENGSTQENSEGAMEVDAVETGAPVTRAVHLTSKVRTRMYTRAVRDLKNLQLRSQETLEKLNFTVDLIQYAKQNIDGAKTRVTEAGGKLASVWGEINMSEEEFEKQQLQGDSADDKTFERRAIATARHLSLKLKRGFSTLASTANILPEGLRTRIMDGAKYTEELYTNFASATSFKDLPNRLLDQTKQTVGYLQETLLFASDYVKNNGVTGLLELLGLKKKASSSEGQISTASKNGVVANDKKTA